LRPLSWRLPAGTGTCTCTRVRRAARPGAFASRPPAVRAPVPAPIAEPAVATERKSWLDKLKTGLRKTGTGIQAVFVNAQIDDALYEELESALLMADTGVKATEFLLDDLRVRVKRQMATTAPQVKLLLADAIADLLKPLEKPLVIGQFTPTVIMVAGVNGAGKTTSIGKLTKHLATEGASVLLAAADTFRAAAREQLLVWADRNTVEIVSNEGGDPSAVSFDAVNAGKARGKDVVLVDTAGRLPTQLHLMDELKKIKRVVSKADATAPHEVLLVIDGNTGQNALAQVKAFDETLGLTGLIVTKLDGTAKGGVLCAIARERPIPVYFIGEKLEDLETRANSRSSATNKKRPPLALGPFFFFFFSSLPVSLTMARPVERVGGLHDARAVVRAGRLSGPTKPYPRAHRVGLRDCALTCDRKASLSVAEASVR
jgi:fused signal recognition particle receptor